MFEFIHGDESIVVIVNLPEGVEEAVACLQQLGLLQRTHQVLVALLGSLSVYGME